ncbi:MFS transporter [Apilactobacillus sp. TMW 2.2459]|uniref:MFS transporter n=1 Tax=Apilactobacillus xinyiensis TaxID=2841032 RepID=UPI00200E6769|nr:MFS transporter [Apilactobacillus xinyiensis]MCL0312612.1 MFS transporter [Apilactobacillus xinyiensis]
MEDNSYWKRNLWVLLFGTFITGVAFNEIIPFMPLYIVQLGSFNKNQLSILSGIVYAISFFIVIFTSPMWGRFADRHGRKRLVLQTSLGSAVTIFLMAFCTNVWQFILLRALQGFFDGVIPNSIALVATSTPRKKVGYALSVLSTGYTSGFLIGPIFGGYLVKILNIRLTFILTGIILFLFFILVFFMVEEKYKPNLKRTNVKRKWYNFLQYFPNPHFVAWMFFISIALQIVTNAIYPIITLFVKELMHNQGDVSVVAGIISAMPGISMVMTAPLFGRIGDRKGVHFILFLGFIVGILFITPQGFVAGVWSLGILRFLNGIANAALFPSVQTLLAKGTPAESTGMAFSLNQGAQAIGICIGSMMGSYISTIFGYNGVFFFSGIVLAITLVVVKLKVPELKKL